MGFSRQEYCSGLSCPPLGDLPNPRIKLRSPALQADSLPSEPPGKPKNTGEGSLCLLQGSFLIQELNWGLLHCRWILYQLRYPGSPTSHGLLLRQYITIYMVFWECVFLGLWGLSSLSRNWTCPWQWKHPNHWTSREFSIYTFNFFFNIIIFNNYCSFWIGRQCC